MAYNPEQNDVGAADPAISAIERLTATLQGHLGAEAVRDEVLLGTPREAESFDPNSYSHIERFLKKNMEETRGKDCAVRTVHGPHHEGFNSILRATNASLRDIRPDLTSAYLVPPAYRERLVDKDIRNSPTLEAALSKVRRTHLSDLKMQGGRNLLSLLRQELPEGLLEAPVYHHQGEHLQDARMLCVNACFRSVHHAIAGWSPPENLLNEAIRGMYGTTLVEDGAYFKLLQTDLFQKMSGRQVKMVEMLGADFEMIRKLTTSIKDRHPHANVVAMASVGSDGFDEDGWHSVILLRKEDDKVICHDPSPDNGRADKPIPITDFARRWAIAYNRVQLAIAI